MTESDDGTSSSSSNELQEAERSWTVLWTDFNRELRDPYNDFNAFGWTYKLLVGRCRLVAHRLGLATFPYRSCIPIFAISLICIVVLSYFLSIRSSIVAPRWCHDAVLLPQCRSLILHDVIVVYLGTMILFHYISACFVSPGVALSSDYDNYSSSKSNDKLSTPPPPTEVLPTTLQWKATKGQGGFWGWNPKLDLEQERRLTSMYMTVSQVPGTIPKSSSQEHIQSKSKSTSQPHNELHRRIDLDTAKTFPSLEVTYKHGHVRPSRCHHCSVCDRDVLQFDHHCVWLNNCVGFNNYRHFLLTVTYLTVGCWYATLMLWKPFYEPLKYQIQIHGWIFAMTQNGLLGVPTVTDIVHELIEYRGILTGNTVVKLVFPLLASVGLVQTVFLAYHIHYVRLALTTLEYKILTSWNAKKMKQQKQDSGPDGTKKTINTLSLPFSNPYNHGWIQNMRTQFGPLWSIFLPVRILPNPPMVNKPVEMSSDKKAT